VLTSLLCRHEKTELPDLEKNALLNVPLAFYISLIQMHKVGANMFDGKESKREGKTIWES
jgi:hypothetical protein